MTCEEERKTGRLLLLHLFRTSVERLLCREVTVVQIWGKGKKMEWVATTGQKGKSSVGAGGKGEEGEFWFVRRPQTFLLQLRSSPTI